MGHDIDRRAVITCGRPGAQHRVIIEERENEGELIAHVLELTEDPLGSHEDDGRRWRTGFNHRGPVSLSFEGAISHYTLLAVREDGLGWWG